MRTALTILEQKKEQIVGDAKGADADHRWINYLEGMMLMSVVNALCTLDDRNRAIVRLEANLGRSAALLLSLGEPVPVVCMEVKP